MLTCLLILYLPLCISPADYQTSVSLQKVNIKYEILEEEIQAEDSWFGIDKVQHFLVSALLTTAGYATAREGCDYSKPHSLYFGSGMAFGLGVAKEVHDHTSKTGNPSFKDLTANALGIGFAALFINFVFIQ